MTTETAPKKNFNWVKGLLIFFCILLSLLLVFLATVWYFSKNLDKIILAEINSRINADMSFQKIDISAFENFPMVSVQLKNISISPKKDKIHPILKAEQISSDFNLMDLINKNYTIRNISVYNAETNLRVDKKGNENYMILIEDPDTNASPLAFELQEIHLINSVVDYKNEKAALSFNSSIYNSTASGDFSASNYKLSLKGETRLSHLIHSGIQYVKEKNVALDLNLSINNKEHIYTFTDAKMKIAEILLLLEGSVIDKKNLSVDLKVNGKDLDVQSFLSILPAKYLEEVKDFESTGNFYFNSIIKGEITEKLLPAINVDFGIKNANISRKDIEIKLKDVSCVGTFTNGAKRNNKSAIVTLKNINANLEGNRITGEAEVKNIEDPFINTSLKADVDLAHFKEFFKVDQIEKIEGILKINGKYKGSLKALESRNVHDIETSGNVELKATNVKLKNAAAIYESINGNFELADKNLNIKNFIINAKENDVKLNGTIENFLPWFFLEDQQILVKADFKSENMNLNNLFLVPAAGERSDSVFKLSFPENIRLLLDLEISKMAFYKFNCSDIKGQMNFSDKKLTTESLSFNTMGGKIKMQGSLEQKGSDRIIAISQTECSNIDLSTLLYQCENFGQKEITDKHLKGKVTADALVYSEWTSSLDMVPGKIKAQSAFSVKDGELIDFKPIQAMGRFIKMDELKHLKFSELKNTIDIKDEIITIPSMEIISNAFTMNIAGTHTFKNYIDYQCNIKLSELLRKKRPVADEEYYEIDENTGGASLYILMKGTPPDNLKITYDKRGVKKKIAESIKTEKQTIKELLRKELDIPDNENLNPKKKKENGKKEEEEVNWEDDVPQ